MTDLFLNIVAGAIALGIVGLVALFLVDLAYDLWKDHNK